MRKEITVTKDYLLILSDEDVIKGEYFLLGSTHINKWNGEGKRPMSEKSKKITHHLPLNGAKPLDGVMLLPEIEDEVERLAEESWNDKISSPYYAFKDGYNKAREKYRFTEEDLRKAFDEGYNIRDAYGDRSDNMTADKYIQSLQQPRYPSHFEFETESIVIGHNGTHNEWGEVIKKTTNHLGQVVAVGTYKYE